MHAEGRREEGKKKRKQKVLQSQAVGNQRQLCNRGSSPSSWGIWLSLDKPQSFLGLQPRCLIPPSWESCASMIRANHRGQTVANQAVALGKSWEQEAEAHSYLSGTEDQGWPRIRLATFQRPFHAEPVLFGPSEMHSLPIYTELQHKDTTLELLSWGAVYSDVYR